MALGYGTIVFVGVLLNLFFMIIAFLFLKPSLINAQVNNWFFLSILAIIPIIGSFVFCFLASTRTPFRIVISPFLIIIFSIFPSLFIGGYILNIYNFQLPGLFYQMNLVSYVFVVIMFYLILTYVAVVFMQPILRSLIGAYAERENLKSSTTFYKTDNLKNILEKIEDKKWLSDLCSMEVINRKETENNFQLTLSKYLTPFYIAIFGKKIETGSYVSITGYKLDENVYKKEIISSEESQYSLAPQIKEMEKTLKLEPVSSEKAEISYEAINYVMSPARFPKLIQYRNEILVGVSSAFFCMVVIIAYLISSIDAQISLGLIALIVSLGIGVINLLRRK